MAGVEVKSQMSPSRKPFRGPGETPMTPVDVRRKLVQTLGLDLVGPDRDSDLLAEVLPQAPSRWYLTGFLVPIDAAEDQKVDEAGVEGRDEGSNARRTHEPPIPHPATG